jgi:hypothetical protein
MVTDIDALRVKYLYIILLSAGAWLRDAVVTRLSMVDGSRSVIKLETLENK